MNLAFNSPNHAYDFLARRKVLMYGANRENKMAYAIFFSKEPDCHDVQNAVNYLATNGWRYELQWNGGVNPHLSAAS